VSTIDSGHHGDGVARRTKRLWTDEEKRSICFQTAAPGVSVAQVARRYAVKVALTPAQLSMLLEGIDWRAPERTWRPLAAG